MAEKERVLLVDDEFGIRTTLSEVLRSQGFDVTAASTVSEALDAMTTTRFHALISDLNIGEPGDGFTLVSAMRRTQPDAITLIITGYPAFDSALEAIRNQVDGYLIKPTKVPELVGFLREKLIANTGKHHAVPRERVSKLIHDHTEEIVSEWRQQLRSLNSPPWTAMSDDQLTNGLRGLVQELSYRVEHPSSQLRPAALESARSHGQLRRPIGAKVPDLLLETRILRQVILNLIHMRLLSLNLSSLFVDLAVISGTIDELLEASVCAFLSH